MWKLSNCAFLKPTYYFKTLKASSLTRNIFKVFSGDMLAKVFSVGTALLLIRGLTVNQYAAYTVYLGILTLVPNLIGGGINLTLVRFSSEYFSKTGKRTYELYFINLLFQVFLYLVLCTILLLFSEKINLLLFGQKGFHSAFRYGLIAGFGLLLTQSGRSIYQAEEKFGTYIKTLWLRHISTFLLICLLLLLNRLNFQTVVRAFIILELCIGTAITLYISGKCSLKRAVKSLNEYSGVIRNFLSSTGWLIAYFFILAAFQKLDIFMLSHFTAEAELANYGVAFRYYSIALLLLGSIHAVLLPRFSQVEMTDAKKQREFTINWIKITVWLIIPILAAVSFGKPIFTWINGVQYDKAFSIFVIFSLGIWLSLMFSPLVNVLVSRKAFKFLFVLALGAFILNFIGNYLFIPIGGGLAAAIVTILSHNLFIQGLILWKVLRAD